MKKNDNKNVERDRKYFPIIVSLFFVGAFAVALKHLNDGNKINTIMVLAEAAVGGVCSVWVGLFAHWIYSEIVEYDGLPRIAVIIIALAIISFAATFFAHYASVEHGDYYCAVCERDIESCSCVEYKRGNICSKCFTEKLIDGKIGYCERCERAFDLEDMRSGYCLDCYTDE